MAGRIGEEMSEALGKSPTVWYISLCGIHRIKGKRGGFRYLYLYLEIRRHIHLLYLLDKNEQEDVSEEQRRQMREWAAEIKREAGN